MAGQEIEGDLWDQYCELDLPRALVSEHVPQPLCKIWAAETHV